MCPGNKTKVKFHVGCSHFQQGADGDHQDLRRGRVDIFVFDIFLCGVMVLGRAVTLH